jgi:hypothetical protein
MKQVANSADLEDEGNMFLRNVGLHSTDYTALCTRRYDFS